MATLHIINKKTGSFHVIEADTIEKAIENIIDTITTDVSDLIDANGQDTDNLASAESLFFAEWDTSDLIIQCYPLMSMNDSMASLEVGMFRRQMIELGSTKTVMKGTPE